MKTKKEYIVFTAGRGPSECAIAVHGIQERFKQCLKVQNIEFNIISLHKGSVQGSIETIVFELAGANTNMIASWIGTHKWICQSPIRKFQKRKNWFIKCEKLLPLESFELKESDVSFQTFRASGPGGQHRNKVETAVRLIHEKSGLIVVASDGKSQHQNRKKAWEKLRSRINELNQSSFQKQNLDKWMAQIEIERGNPIKVFESMKFKEKE